MNMTVNRINIKLVVVCVQTKNSPDVFVAAGQTDRWEPLRSPCPLCGGIMKKSKNNTDKTLGQVFVVYPNTFNNIL